MRHAFKLAALTVCVFATPAMAQDWTGAYIGVNGGYTDAKSEQTVVLGGNWSVEPAALQTYVTANYPTDSKVQNVNYGGQIGYNVQSAGGLVIGVEADVSALSGTDTQTRGPLIESSIPSLSYTVTNTFDPKVTYGVKGKLGFATGDMLIYATGGWAWTQADLAMDITSNGGYHKIASFDHTFDGWQAGAGIEQRISNNVSLRLDYAYSDQGDVTYTTGYATGSTFQTPAYTETFTQDLKMHLVRVGINLHF